MPENVSTFRLYLMRGGYLVNVVLVGLGAWPALLNHTGPWDPVRGAAFSLYAALSTLSALGLRYPLNLPRGRAETRGDHDALSGCSARPAEAERWAEPAGASADRLAEWSSSGMRKKAGSHAARDDGNCAQQAVAAVGAWRDHGRRR